MDFNGHIAAFRNGINMVAASPGVSTTFDGDILVDKVASLNGTQYLELNSNNLNLVGTTVNVNGAPIGGASGIFLPRDGSLAMTGDLKMGGNDISNVATIGAFTAAGQVTMGSQVLSVNTMGEDGTNGMVWGAGSSASASTALVVGRGSSTGADCAVFGRNSASTGTQSTLVGLLNNNTAGNQCVLVGVGNSTDSGGNIAIGSSNTCTGANAVAIGSGLTNSTANSILLGSSEAASDLVNIRPQTNGTADLGTSGARWKDAHLSGSIVGSVKTSGANDLVTNTGASVDQRVVVFSGTTGKLITDSGATLSQYAALSGATFSGAVAMGNNSISGVSSLAATSAAIPSIDYAGALAIGGTSATSLAIGRTGVTTTLNGTAAASKVTVLGAPVDVGIYSTYADVSVANTNVETDITASGSALGSLVLSNNQSVGMVLLFDLNTLVTSAGGDTVTIRLKVNGATVLTHSPVIPISTNRSLIYRAQVTVRSSSIQICSTENNGGSIASSQTNVAYTPGQSNTWLATAQWSGSASTLVMKQLIVSAKFIAP